MSGNNRITHLFFLGQEIQWQPPPYGQSTAAMLTDNVARCVRTKRFSGHPLLDLFVDTKVLRFRCYTHLRRRQRWVEPRFGSIADGTAQRSGVRRGNAPLSWFCNHLVCVHHPDPLRAWHGFFRGPEIGKHIAGLSMPWRPNSCERTIGIKGPGKPTAKHMIVPTLQVFHQLPQALTLRLNSSTGPCGTRTLRGLVSADGPIDDVHMRCSGGSRTIEGCPQTVQAGHVILETVLSEGRGVDYWNE